MDSSRKDTPGKQKKTIANAEEAANAARLSRRPSIFSSCNQRGLILRALGFRLKHRRPDAKTLPTTAAFQCGTSAGEPRADFVLGFRVDLQSAVHRARTNPLTYFV